MARINSNKTSLISFHDILVTVIYVKVKLQAYQARKKIYSPGRVDLPVNISNVIFAYIKGV